MIADVNETRLHEAVTGLKSHGAQAIGVQCDVSSDADVERLRDQALERFGRVDILVNNAGVCVLGPPERVTMADWEWILQINVLGIVRGVRAFVPAMLERGSGYVVNTASVAGIWAYSWDSPAYATSKFAAYGYTEALARSLRPHGIGVSVLLAGLVTTNFGENARFSGVPEDRLAESIYLPQELMDPIAPEVVGPLVADAIEQGQFAIFTHPSQAQRFRTWRVDIERSLTDAIAASPTPPKIL